MRSADCRAPEPAQSPESQPLTQKADEPMARLVTSIRDACVRYGQATQSPPKETS